MGDTRDVVDGRWDRPGEIDRLEQHVDDGAAQPRVEPTVHGWGLGDIAPLRESQDAFEVVPVAAPLETREDIGAR